MAEIKLKVTGMFLLNTGYTAINLAESVENETRFTITCKDHNDAMNIFPIGNTITISNKEKPTKEINWENQLNESR